MNWKLFFSLGLIVLIVLSNVKELVKTEDWKKFLKETGGRLFSANHNIGIFSQRIIDSKGIFVETERPDSLLTKYIKVPWAYIKSIFSLIVNFMVFIFWFVIFIEIAKKITNNASAQFGVFIVAIIFYLAITDLYAAYFIYPQIEIDTGAKVPLSTKLNPFSGIMKMVEAFKFFSPIYSQTTIPVNATQFMEQYVPDNVILV